jgi:hypothetical protein
VTIIIDFFFSIKTQKNIMKKLISIIITNARQAAYKSRDFAPGKQAEKGYLSRQETLQQQQAQKPKPKP